MTTITVDEQTQAGKILLELAKILAVSSKGIAIETTESDSKSRDIKKEDTTTFDSDEFDLDESLGLK